MVGCTANSPAHTCQATAAAAKTPSALGLTSKDEEFGGDDSDVGHSVEQSEVGASHGGVADPAGKKAGRQEAGEQAGMFSTTADATVLRSSAANQPAVACHQQASTE